ncbi:2454_t:CDS:2, partial [Diversispora eburnea]
DITSHTEAFRRPIPTSDSYPISEMQREEQERHLLLQDITSHAEAFRRPIPTSDTYPISEMQQSHPTKGVLPAIYPEKVVQGSLITNIFPNAHLANIAGVIRSLRTGDDMRHTSGLGFFDSIRHLATSERSAPSQKNPTFLHKKEFIRHLNQTLPKSAGADRYNIHVYSSAPPQISTERSNPDTLWQHTYENSPIFGPPLPEWRSHIDDVTVLGNSTETVFGSNESG